MKKYALGFLQTDHYYLESQRLNLDWIPDAENFWDMEKFRQDPRPKILMISPFNPGGSFPHQGDYSWVDLIVAATSEFLSDYFDRYMERAQQALNNSNIIFISGGQVQNPNNSPRIYCTMISWISHLYENCWYKPQGQPNPRPYLFDALLGQNLQHRLYVFYRLKESGLLNQSLVSMFRTNRGTELTKQEVDQILYDHYVRDPVCGDFVKRHGLVSFYRSPELDSLELHGHPCPKDDPLNFETSFTTDTFSRAYPERKLCLSMDPPVGIYNASWYSIVTETKHRVNELFISEKTAKPLLCKRVFVLFGAPGCLQILRDNGFKTFSSIIDESYDNEIDDRHRFDMAWQQVERLSVLNPVEVYQQVHDILEHNYNHIPTLSNEHLKIREFIAQYLPR